MGAGGRVAGTSDRGRADRVGRGRDAGVRVDRRLAARGPVDPVVEEATRRIMLNWASDVTSLASVLCISERQLRRRFEAATGFAPKILQRILRFQRFIALARQPRQRRPNLALLAAEAGYADQAHLSRDSLRLAGRSPGSCCANPHATAARPGTITPRHTVRCCGCGTRWPFRSRFSCSLISSVEWYAQADRDRVHEPGWRCSGAGRG